MEATAERWALSSGLCDDLEGVVGEGGRSRRDGIHVHRELIHLQQKVT